MDVFIQNNNRLTHGYRIGCIRPSKLSFGFRLPTLSLFLREYKKTMKSKLEILISLANSDSKISENEEKLIRIIAKANNIEHQEVDRLLQQPQTGTSLGAYTEEEKFEALYLMIQLMKVDGQVFKSEIDFCEKIAEKLGYRKEVVRELSAGIFSDPSITSDRDLLMKKAGRFLSK